MPTTHELPANNAKKDLPLIVDAHEDLAWNMLTFGRNYTRSVAETRQIEAGTTQLKVKEDTLLGWPDYQRGRVALVFATLFAVPLRLRSGNWETIAYADTLQANRLYWEQVDLYYRLEGEAPDKFRLVKNQHDLQTLLDQWNQPESTTGNLHGHRPVGLTLLMEGAEGIRAPSELEEWWAAGVRIIGPAWAGNRFCGGTREPGRLTRDGIELLEHMAELGFGLDLSHMDESAALQALGLYPDRILATHSNAKALLNRTLYSQSIDSNRHLSDELIRGLVERNGVIGIVPFNAFLLPGWRAGDRRELASLEHVVAQIDKICQMAGDAKHVGIGTDFDGGFGLQSVPAEIDTITDLQKLGPLLAERGYSNQDITAIFSGNWLRLLRDILD